MGQADINNLLYASALTILYCKENFNTLYSLTKYDVDSHLFGSSHGMRNEV